MTVLAGHELGIDGGMQAYNCLDSANTLEIYDEILLEAAGIEHVYNFELGLQGPVLEMMLRGFLVSPSALDLGIQQTERELARTDYVLDRLATAVWDRHYTDKETGKIRPLNPNSGHQLRAFFYDTMGITPVVQHKKGEEKLPMDRETLEKLEAYFMARPIVAAILARRDLAKQLQVLKTEIDPDWHLRTSYNIGGTTTTRFSSSKTPEGTGNNLQNITESLRHICIAEKGYKLYGIDLEQAESREVGLICGLLFGDWRYLDACEAGDLHSAVCRMVWPNLGWTGDKKKDREIADQPFYRDKSYRDVCKTLGHGCLTEDHEVLTPNGWVSIANKPAVIMQFDKGVSKFVGVQHWTDFVYEGNFYCWEGQSLSAKMTQDHRVYYTTTEEFTNSVATAPNVPNSARVPNGWGYIGGNENITSEIARLIAAYQCDGYYETGNLIRFHFHKDRKFFRLEELALKAEIEFKQSGDKASINVGSGHNWPKTAGAYLLTWPKAALEAYLDELPYWDGHFGKTSVSLASKNLEHLDWIRTCNRLVGRGGNLQKEQISGFGTTMYKLQINNRCYASMSSVERKIEQGKQRVLCPTVPSGAFYIRRNGKISVTGNSNYLGKPPQMSLHSKIPVKLVQDFQERYFAAFPAIPRWHHWVAQQLQTTRRLTNVFGWERDFFDRPESDETLRAAVASMPQSATAQRLNLGMWRLWRHCPEFLLTAQLHDAVYFQAPEDMPEHEVATKALKEIEIKLAYRGRPFCIPGEAKAGRNWGRQVTQEDVDKAKAKGKIIRLNVDGLRKVKYPELKLVV